MTIDDKCPKCKGTGWLAVQEIKGGLPKMGSEEPIVLVTPGEPKTCNLCDGTGKSPRPK